MYVLAIALVINKPNKAFFGCYFKFKKDIFVEISVYNV